MMMYQAPAFRFSNAQALGSSGLIESAVEAASASVSNAVRQFILRGSENAATVSISKSHSDAEGYAALWATLAGMAKADPNSSDYIDEDTRFDASNFLAILASFEVAPPKVFAHGGDAATFTWDVPAARRRYVTPVEGEVAFHETGRDNTKDIDAVYQLGNAHSLNTLMRALGGNV